MKYLLLHLDRTFGPSEADAFLQLARLDRDYLEDETRPLANERWLSALEVFASRWGREEIGRAVRAVVDSENLGVWTRVLRGASNPAEAYSQLDQYGGEQVLTERWQTLSVAANRWKGRVTLQEHERNGLCGWARSVELASVPLLFGMPAAKVERAEPEPDGNGGLGQEFSVTWDAPVARAWIHGSLLGLAAGIATGAVGTSTLTETALGGAAGAIIGAGSALVWGWTRQRSVESRAHWVRLLALERAAALREARDQNAAGFRAGTVIAGQYRLVQPVGSGASGAIWEAVRLADGECVAIKVLRSAMAHDTVAADRLRREAAALGLAWHPNVVEVYDEGSLPDGTIYLVMERLRGETLAARLRRQRRLPPEELQTIALQVCDALGAVHAAGVVHRDLKPGNVFLHRPDPQGPMQAKLLDFGIARVEWEETRLTNNGAPLGTPGYMSPEQYEGLEVDLRSDLFALGSVLYESLTGQPPPNHPEDLWRERPEHAPSGTQRALAEIPEDWRRIVEKATAYFARDRYPDARAMRDAIAELGNAHDAPGVTG